MISCDVCHFENPDGFAYCGRCGNGLSTSDVTVEFTNTTLEGERKQVTVIFADISGFTALNDAAETAADVEQVLQIVNHCIDLLSEVVHEYDGYIDKYMGDAIMAVFGAPKNHEDDPERALRTALAMQERLSEFNENPPFPLAEPLGIHLGINTGTVIAGLVGNKRKRAYTVMGDAVNVASRLEGVSERGEILVSQDTYNLTNRLFIFKEREPVFVKGKKEALELYELVNVRSERASQRGIAGLRAPIVGRDKEVEAVRRQIDRLHHNTGGVTVVVGEAGLGKSRLISELQQETKRIHANIEWLEGRGLSFQQNLSYKLFIEILRAYLGAGADEPGEVVWQKWQLAGSTLFGDRHNEVTPYLATLMGIKLDESLTQNMPLSEPSILQQRMFMAVGEWVEAVARQKPLVLVFEDLHWADPSSVNLIEYLISVSQQLPLLIICITRPDRDADFWGVKKRASSEYPSIYTEFNLEPLTQDQSRFLVDQLLKVEQLPDVLEALILSRSEGNPLFMEEVLRSLIEDETLIKEGDTWIMARPVTEIDIPETLSGVLTARIDRLSEPVKRTLQIAAVIGRVFHRFVLEAVSDDTQNLDEHLAALAAAELIRERPNDVEKEYIFKHVLIQETAYNNQLLQQRRSSHKKIADYLAQLYWLRGEEYASVAARHYEQSEVWDRALTYLNRAAEAAKNAFDNMSAINFYTRALNMYAKIDKPNAVDRMQIYEGRGNLLMRSGKIDEARADFEIILQLAEAEEDQVAQMRTLGQLGKLHDGYEGFGKAARYYERALAIARVIEDRSGIVDTLNQLAEFNTNMGQLDKANTYLHEALTIAQDLGNKRRIATTQSGLAAVMLYQGEISASIEQLEDLAQTWRNLGYYQGLMQTYVSLAMAYSLQANYHKSDEICQDGLEILDRFGDMNWVPQFRSFLADNAFARGNLTDAETHIEAMIQSAEKLGKGIWRSLGMTKRGYLKLIQGDAASGLAEIQQGAALAESIGSLVWSSRTRVLLGAAYRFSQDPTESEAILEMESTNLRRVNMASDEVIALSELLETYVVSEHWDKIPARVSRLRELTTACEMPTYRAKSSLVAAQLAAERQEMDVAIQALHEARDITRTTGDQFIALVVETTLGRIQCSQAQYIQAKEHLSCAEAILTQIADTLPTENHIEMFLNTTFGKSVNAIKASLDAEKVS